MILNKLLNFIHSSLKFVLLSSPENLGFSYAEKEIYFYLKS